MSTLFVAAMAVLLLTAEVSAQEPTRASESLYETDISKATTSLNMTKADIAWHALNTYGWDCNEVISRGELNAPVPRGYFIVTCANGTKLRVYPREHQHPRITNIEGTYTSRTSR